MATMRVVATLWRIRQSAVPELCAGPGGPIGVVGRQNDPRTPGEPWSRSRRARAPGIGSAEGRRCEHLRTTSTLVRESGFSLWKVPMHSFGLLVLFFTVVPGLVALLQFRKMKKILAAPFRKTAEVAANPGSADAKGLVSCEGTIIAPQQPLYSPVSGRPCLAYKVELRQNWHRYVRTENGMKRETGSSNITTQKVGSVFYLNDGSGHVAIDATKGIDTDYEQAAKQVQGVSWGDVQFGNFRWSVSSPGGDKSGDSVECIESVVRPDGSAFVMGKLVGGGITQEAGVFGNLLMSRKGRNALVGATKRNAIIGAVFAGICVLSGTPMAIFGEDAPPTAYKDPCQIVDESEPGKLCTGKITNDDGKTLSFKVTQPGTFQFHAHAPSGIKIPLDPVVTVKDQSGKEILNHEGTQPVEVELAPGTYSVNVRDEIKGAPSAFQGGFSFELQVKKTAGAAEVTVAVASASAAPSAKPQAKGQGQPKAGSKPSASGSAAVAPSGKTSAPSASAPSGPVPSAKPAAPAAGSSAKPPAPKK